MRSRTFYSLAFVFLVFTLPTALYAQFCSVNDDTYRVQFSNNCGTSQWHLEAHTSVDRIVAGNWYAFGQCIGGDYDCNGNYRPLGNTGPALAAMSTPEWDPETNLMVVYWTLDNYYVNYEPCAAGNSCGVIENVTNPETFVGYFYLACT